MIVVQVTHYMPPHPGGIERVADTLFEAYRGAGITVEWIASRVPRHAPAREPGKQRVACLNLLETMLDVPVPLWGPGAVRTLADAVRRADVVHVHDCLYPGSALAIHLARRHGRPTLLTQHIGVVRYHAPLLNAVERAAYATLGRRLLRAATHLVMATPAAEAHARELLGGLPPNLSVIPNGIDLRRFRPADAAARRHAREQLALEGDAPVVLFTGRLVEKKGLPIVLDVARRLPDARMLVVGDGPLASLMNDAPANVRWIRSVPAAEMTRYYHASDCLLMPSTGEGLPLVIQEALACGLAAVVSDNEPYAVALAAEGVVLPSPREPDRLAAELQRAYASRGSAACERVRRYAEQNWDLNVMTRRYVELLHSMVPGANQPNERSA